MLASQWNPTDADVLVLAVTHYDFLLKSVFIMSMVSSVVQVQSIWTALCPDSKCFASLPRIHWGQTMRLGKATWLQVYIIAGGSVNIAVQMLSDAAKVTEELLSTLAIFVCSAYPPNCEHS